MKKFLGTLTIIITLGSIISGWIYIDERFAHADDLIRMFVYLDNRLENNLLNDQIRYLDRRIMDIEKEYPKGNMPIMVLDQYRELKKQRKKLEEQMKENMKLKVDKTKML